MAYNAGASSGNLFLLSSQSVSEAMTGKFQLFGVVK